MDNSKKNTQSIYSKNLRTTHLKYMETREHELNIARSELKTAASEFWSATKQLTVKTGQWIVVETGLVSIARDIDSKASTAVVTVGVTD